MHLQLASCLNTAELDAKRGKSENKGLTFTLAQCAWLYIS